MATQRLPGPGLGGPAPRRLTHHEGLAVPGGLAEWKPLPTIHGSDSGAADVGEDQAADSMTPGLAGDAQSVEMASDAAGEPDRPVPPRGFGKHQVGAGRPVRELEELRSPHHLDGRVGYHHQIAGRRVAGVYDGA